MSPTTPDPWSGSTLYDPADVAKDIAWRVHPWLLTPHDGKVIVEHLIELGLAREIPTGYVEVANMDPDTLIDAACDALDAERE